MLEVMAVTQLPESLLKFPVTGAGSLFMMLHAGKSKEGNSAQGFTETRRHQRGAR